jgi:glycosyltransferase involved in cell wall biosynthesis
MHGRSKGHDLDDGTHTRVKIDLFPEYIRNLPTEKRALWEVIGRALWASPERTRLVLLASGLAVVAFNQGAAHEHIANGISGMRVSADEPQAFISAVFALGVDDVLREAVRQNARIAVAALAPEMVIAEFESMLKRLTRENSNGNAALAARI